MKLVNQDKWNDTYSEISQTNPLRWQNLKKLTGDEYEPVSHWWKCKDFMNEVVTSRYTKQCYSIYGFSVDPATFFNPKDKYLPILLKNILPGWDNNINVVNEGLKLQGMPPVEWDVGPSELDDTHRFIQIPLDYLDNTLFMSVVTLYIRLANTEEVYSSLDEMVSDSVNRGDAENYKAAVQKPFNKMTDSLKKYIWYYNDEINLPKDYKGQKVMTSTMHNCGVVSWGWR